MHSGELLGISHNNIKNIPGKDTMKSYIKKILYIFALLSIILFVSCEGKPTDNIDSIQNDSLPSTDEKKEEKVPFPPKLRTWVAYWDLKDIDIELSQIAETLNSLSYFQVYFNHENELVIPEQFEKMYKIIEKAELSENITKYLTFVNDQRLEDDSFLLKDTNLLKILLADEKSAEKHAKDIVGLTLQYGYDGLEIDYEAIRKDFDLWDKFISFLEILKNTTKEAGLDLRVILEPYIPYDQIIFPDGIEYVIMCYNYYGTHSGPGPKASPSFIEEIIIKTKSLPGDVIYAIATGGVQWDTSEKGTSLTESAATDLALKYNTEPTRDKDSGCMVFEYYDKTGMKFDVWYADDETLKLWINTIQVLTENENDIAIWRIGGNISLENLTE